MASRAGSGRLCIDDYSAAVVVGCCGSHFGRVHIASIYLTSQLRFCSVPLYFLLHPFPQERTNLTWPELSILTARNGGEDWYLTRVCVGVAVVMFRTGFV